jgi:hypothetical protein
LDEFYELRDNQSKIARARLNHGNANYDDWRSGARNLSAQSRSCSSAATTISSQTCNSMRHKSRNRQTLIRRGVREPYHIYSRFINRQLQINRHESAIVRRNSHSRPETETSRVPVHFSEGRYAPRSSQTREQMDTCRGSRSRGKKVPLNPASLLSDAPSALIHP